MTRTPTDRRVAYARLAVAILHPTLAGEARGQKIVDLAAEMR
jgi:hypothetical protein